MVFHMLGSCGSTGKKDALVGFDDEKGELCHACLRSKKHRLYLETVRMHCGLYSITPDIGDLYDINLFCKYIGVRKTELKLILKCDRIPFTVYSGVLCFTTEELAEKAIKAIYKFVDAKVSLRPGFPVA